MNCCPYYASGGCTVAAALRLCKGPAEHTGSCATTPERCCGILRLVDGSEVRLWETCRLYMHAADCRYCRHFDPKRNWCRAYNKRVEYYQGTCPRYEGPRPVPSLAVKR